MNKLTLLWHTVRELKLQQISARISNKLLWPLQKITPAIHQQAPPVRQPAAKCIFSKDQATDQPYQFLGQIYAIDDATVWNDVHIPKLWLYNLHYCKRYDAKLIERWLDENPPLLGNGWAPYVLSRRIINWVKHHLAGNHLSAKAIASLAMQADALNKRLEYHLLGNHLLVNAVALQFAGLFFKGKQADKWYQRGKNILQAQLAEQWLPDGGHFELSPMYHALLLEDLLDLLHLHKVYQREIAESWQLRVRMMLAWYQRFSYPDGSVPHFNDVSEGESLPAERLLSYAANLGLAPLTSGLCDSYYFRLQNDHALCFYDAAPVGASYIPGHAHADSLSFELMLGAQKVFINGGTGTYENNSLRHQLRSTAAHNTLVIDKQNSSQVWASFRVAQRAHVEVHTVATDMICATHDGYRRLLAGNITHQRRLHLHASHLQITDTIAGQGAHHVASYLHLAPNLSVQIIDKHSVYIVNEQQRLICQLLCEPTMFTLTVEDSWVYPAWGEAIANQTIILQAQVSLPITISVCCQWPDLRNKHEQLVSLDTVITHKDPSCI